VPRDDRDVTGAAAAKVRQGDIHKADVVDRVHGGGVLRDSLAVHRRREICVVVEAGRPAGDVCRVHVLEGDVRDRSHLVRPRAALPRARGHVHLDRRRARTDGNVLENHGADVGAVHAGDPDASLSRVQAADVLEVDIGEIAGCFAPELDALWSERRQLSVRRCGFVWSEFDGSQWEIAAPKKRQALVCSAIHAPPAAANASAVGQRMSVSNRILILQ